MRVIFTTDTSDSGVFYFDTYIPEEAVKAVKFLNEYLNSTLLLSESQIVRIDFGKDYKRKRRF